MQTRDKNGKRYRYRWCNIRVNKGGRGGTVATTDLQDLCWWYIFLEWYGHPLQPITSATLCYVMHGPMTQGPLNGLGQYKWQHQKLANHCSARNYSGKCKVITIMPLEWVRHKYRAIRSQAEQESRAAARKPRDAARVLFCWSLPTTFTKSIRLAKLRKRPRFRAPNMLTHNAI